MLNTINLVVSDPEWFHGDLQCCKNLRACGAADGAPKWDLSCHYWGRPHETHNQIWHDSKFLIATILLIPHDFGLKTALSSLWS